MTTLVISHPACLAHDMGEGHPERPGSLARRRARPRKRGVPDAGARRSAARGPCRHRAGPSQGLYRSDPRGDAGRRDTRRSIRTPRCRRASFEAALRAAGGAVFAVDEVDARQGQQRLRCRSPARPSRRRPAPMGFCLFNLAAVAARQARAGAWRGSGWRWWISTCITATERSGCSGPNRGALRLDPSRSRFIRAPERSANAAVQHRRQRAFA